MCDTNENVDGYSEKEWKDFDLPRQFPRAELETALAAIGYHDVEVQPEQESTFRLTMWTENPATTSLEVEQQIKAVVQQIPAFKGVGWRVELCVAVIPDRRHIGASFRVVRV